MKAFNKLSVVLLLSGGALCHQAMADNNVFTVMDDPSTAKKTFEGNAAAGYLAQTGNTTSSSLTANTNMTWYQPSTAYSLWGNASNTSSNDVRASETYQIGARTRYNLNSADYLFGQASWLAIVLTAMMGAPLWLSVTVASYSAARYIHYVWKRVLAYVMTIITMAVMKRRRWLTVR